MVTYIITYCFSRQDFWCMVLMVGIIHIPCRSVITISNMKSWSMFENSCSLCSKGSVSRSVRVSGDSLLLVTTVTTITLELSPDDTNEYTVAVMFPSTDNGWSLTAYSLSYAWETRYIVLYWHVHTYPQMFGTYVNSSQPVQCCSLYSQCFLPL